MTIGTDIGDRVMDLRIERDLTQEVLAEMAGTSPTTISNLESGKIKNPQYRTMRRIAAALGVDVEELIAPKAPNRPSPAAPEEVLIEERLLSYVWSQKLQVEQMRERWEAAAEQNTFSYEAWNEAAEVAIEIERAFADAVPVAIYATGEKWLPREEWDAVSELLGNITVLKLTIEHAFHAYQSRFGKEGVPAHIKDLSAIQEQRKRATGAAQRTHDQARGVG